MLILITSLFSLSVFSQACNVAGTITDVAGNVLPGVSVVVKGTTTGSVTDVNGKYTIRIPSDESVLVFSFVGYKTQEVIVNQQTEINLVLEEEVKEMEEVVVVGYGTMKKS